MATPAADLLSYPPGVPLPRRVPAWADIAAAARAAFPERADRRRHALQLHRAEPKRPPRGVFDYVTHATSALVHAADDRSVMETLRRWNTSSARRGPSTGGTPYRIGPSHIANSFNPYGAKPHAQP